MNKQPLEIKDDKSLLCESHLPSSHWRHIFLQCGSASCITLYFHYIFNEIQFWNTESELSQVKNLTPRIHPPDGFLFCLNSSYSEHTLTPYKNNEGSENCQQVLVRPCWLSLGDLSTSAYTPGDNTRTSFLPDIAVRSALLLNSSVIPRPLQTSFRSISCSTVNL